MNFLAVYVEDMTDLSMHLIGTMSFKYEDK